LTPLARLRPYTYQIFLLAYTPLGLYADAHVANVYQQDALGVLTFGVLFAVLRFSPREQRRQVWLAVLIATAGELYFSLGVGLYRYRFDNVPLYVPAGHGLVYLFALTAAATPLMLRRRRLLVGLALGLATSWALFGVTLLPLLTGRLDMTGALLWPVFAYFTLRSRQAPVYAAAFLMTSVLELFGTGFQNWTWQAIAPISHLHQGNPPSVIAGAYCLLDAVVMRLSAVVGGRARRQEGGRIDGVVGLPELEVEVGAGRVAGRPLAADDLALGDGVPHLDRDPQEVPVERGQPAGVGDDDVVAVPDQDAVHIRPTGQ
jgi:hypothetical protein